MYMSLFGCRCKQPLIKLDQPQIKQRWSRTKTTTYQQRIEDDKWGHHMEQGGGPTPQNVGRPTHIWWAPTWPTLPLTSPPSRRLVGPTWKQKVGRPTCDVGPPWVGSLPLTSPWWTCDGNSQPLIIWRFQGRFDPMVEKREHADRWRCARVVPTPSPPINTPLESLVKHDVS